MDILRREEFVFVRDFDGTISGIITAADVVLTYDETATPFLLIGEVDQELRRAVRNAFDLRTVRQACTSAGVQPPKSFERMTMGTYQAVLNDPGCWQQLAWPLDREVFIKRLDELRRIRNTVMHFNPDPVKSGDVARLRYFLDLIRTFIVYRHHLRLRRATTCLGWTIRPASASTLGSTTGGSASQTCWKPAYFGQGRSCSISGDRGSTSRICVQGVVNPAGAAGAPQPVASTGGTPSVVLGLAGSTAGRRPRTR
ncbi:hypothetical protein I0C86_23260 [Plantactinospora sp. S1510]|uniref:CBS domain-containing protein n=2 Tax=Plantactinospora alkalitolerans TaxID=2789879 RepID=A0ABS0H087_9ACTN|nr:hypothetical protein [Plantactinospora alkalitolerans]